MRTARSLILVALALAACGKDEKSSARPAAPAAPAGPRDAAGNAVSPWPPVVGQPYPDLELWDASGKTVRLSSFKGKVLLIEPIGMNCPACIRLAGGAKEGVGAFGGVAPEDGEHSTEDYMSWFSIDPDDGRLVYVQLLLYSLSMQGPTAEDAREWGEHFKIARHPNWTVLAGGPGLINQASYDLIPGYQLVGKDFVLRYDAAGHKPKTDATQFWQAVPALLAE